MNTESSNDPGTIRTVYRVTENSDKTEGRGHTIRTKHFFNKKLAKQWAKGRGPMGSDETVWDFQVILGTNGAWYHLGQPFVERIEDSEAILSILQKLTPEERKVLKNYLD